MTNATELVATLHMILARLEGRVLPQILPSELDQGDWIIIEDTLEECRRFAKKMAEETAP